MSADLKILGLDSQTIHPGTDRCLSMLQHDFGARIIDTPWQNLRRDRLDPGLIVTRQTPYLKLAQEWIGHQLSHPMSDLNPDLTFMDEIRYRFFRDTISLPDQYLLILSSPYRIQSYGSLTDKVIETAALCVAFGLEQLPDRPIAHIDTPPPDRKPTLILDPFQLDEASLVQALTHFLL